MNERIKLLAEQANTRTFINEDGSLTPELYKFTELIVKELIKVAGTEMGYSEYCFMRDKVNKHFGVEK